MRSGRTKAAFVAALLISVLPASAKPPAPLARVGGAFGTCSTLDETAVPSATVKALLSNKTLTKSEYESAAEYGQRIAPIIDKISPVRITFGLLKSDGVYNAETETYTISPDILPHHLDLIEDFLAFTDGRYWFGRHVGGTATPPTRYTAQNVYGAKVKVSKFDRTVLEYVLPGARNHTQPNPPIAIHIPRRNSELIVALLKVVIEGDVVAPWFIADTRHHSPNIIDRTDIETSIIGVPIAPKCGAIVDGLSGKVLATFDPAQLSPWYVP